MSLVPKPTDAVGDDEPLLRSIDGDQEHGWEDGRFRLASTSFNDINRQPSVDRERLRVDPLDARLKPDDGVARLLARSVRGIDLGSRDPKNPTSIPVNVVPDPLDAPINNPAHALIKASKEISGTNFKRLKESLARLAEKDILLHPAKWRVVGQ